MIRKRRNDPLSEARLGRERGALTLLSWFERVSDEEYSLPDSDPTLKSLDTPRAEALGFDVKPQNALLFRIATALADTRRFRSDV